MIICTMKQDLIITNTIFERRNIMHDIYTSRKVEQTTIRVDTTAINCTDDMKEILISLCDNDFNMNGDNGDEYTWDIALENGYTTSAEYLADFVLAKVKKREKLLTKQEALQIATEDFIDAWLGNDDYYISYAVSVTHVYDATIITFSYITEG